MAKHGLSDVIKLNIFLLLCYAFLLVQLIDHPHVEFRLFLMLLINKIVRVEGMLINGGWREVFRKGWKVVGVWFVMLAMANWVEDRGVDRCIQEFADVGLVWGLYGCFVGFCDEKKGKDMN